MTDRQTIREMLSAYLDRELPESDVQRVEQALQQDETLQQELSELRQVRQMLRNLGQESAPDGFTSRVMDRVERKHLLEASQTGGAFHSARWFSLAAAALVLFVIGIGALIVSMLKTPIPSQPGQVYATRQEKPDASIPEDKKAAKKLNSKAFDVVRGLETSEDVMAYRSRLKGTGVEGALAAGPQAVVWTANLDDTMGAVRKSLASNRIAPKQTFEQRSDSRQVQILVFANDQQITQLRADMSRLNSVNVAKLSRDKRLANGRFRTDQPVLREANEELRLDAEVAAAEAEDGAPSAGMMDKAASIVARDPLEGDVAEKAKTPPPTVLGIPVKAKKELERVPVPSPQPAEVLVRPTPSAASQPLPAAPQPATQPATQPAATSQPQQIRQLLIIVNNVEDIAEPTTKPATTQPATTQPADSQ